MESDSLACRRMEDAPIIRSRSKRANFLDMATPPKNRKH
jgi:hypothetical protein